MNRTSTARIVAPHVFVGRGREMDALTAALDDAIEGRGGLALVTGEPGIGKTSIAEHLAALAVREGVCVSWGRCWEEEGTPPYWPWLQIVQALDLDGSGQPDLFNLGIPSLDPAGARFRQFAAVVAALQERSRNRPLVLVLDDLHCADHASILLLDAVARELATMAVLVVGTYRDRDLRRDHRLLDTLGGLCRRGRRIELAGLTEYDVGRFVEATVAVRPSTATIRAVHGQTDGNPFFITEVVRALAHDPAPAAHDCMRRPSLPVPASVAEMIGSRLNRLSGDCSAMLTAAAVVGREFDVDVVAAALEVSGEALLTAVDEARDAGLVVELADWPGRCRFCTASSVRRSTTGWRWLAGPTCTPRWVRP